MRPLVESVYGKKWYAIQNKETGEYLFSLSYHPTYDPRLNIAKRFHQVVAMYECRPPLEVVKVIEYSDDGWVDSGPLL